MENSLLPLPISPNFEPSATFKFDNVVLYTDDNSTQLENGTKCILRGITKLDVVHKKSTKEDGGSSAQHRNWLKVNDL